MAVERGSQVGPDAHRGGEDAAAFLRRLRRLEETTLVERPAAAPARFAALTDDARLERGSEGYALRFRHTSAEQIRRLGASDLLSALQA